MYVSSDLGMHQMLGGGGVGGKPDSCLAPWAQNRGLLPTFPA